MQIDRAMSVVSLAREVPGAIGVLETLGVDYACGAKVTVEDAARAAGLDPGEVVAALRKLGGAEKVRAWNERPLSDLVAYLVAQHHRFVREELASIALQLSDVCAEYGRELPDLVALRATFTHLSDILLPHLHREEDDVFPAIVAMEKAWQANAEAPAQSELRQHIHDVVTEHGDIATHLRGLRSIRGVLAADSGLPAGCRFVLAKLEKLEAHLHEYIFLENCIVLPRALGLDEQAVRRAPAL